jgi:DNA-binding NarL/FixJ family response regulator
MPKRPPEPEFPLSLKPLTRHSAELRGKILSLVKKGKSQRAIARVLKISLGTVGYHVKRLRAAGQLP